MWIKNWTFGNSVFWQVSGRKCPILKMKHKNMHTALVVISCSSGLVVWRNRSFFLSHTATRETDQAFLMGCKNSTSTMDASRTDKLDRWGTLLSDLRIWSRELVHPGTSVCPMARESSGKWSPPRNGHCEIALWVPSSSILQGTYSIVLTGLIKIWLIVSDFPSMMALFMLKVTLQYYETQPWRCKDSTCGAWNEQVCVEMGV